MRRLIICGGVGLLIATLAGCCSRPWWCNDECYPVATEASYPQAVAAPCDCQH